MGTTVRWQRARHKAAGFPLQVIWCFALDPEGARYFNAHMRFVALLLPLAFLCPPVHGTEPVPSAPEGGGSAVDAEHVRISEEMHSLAERHAWHGVERKYGVLMGLGVPLTADDHLAGAHASNEFGDLLATRRRLLRAVKTDGGQEVHDWLHNLTAQYARVELVAAPARSTELTVAIMPFDPSQRRAIESAMAATEREGVFTGLLPKGAYVFGGQAFDVTPGMGLRLEVSSRKRRKAKGVITTTEPKDPSGGEAQ